MQPAGGQATKELGGALVARLVPRREVDVSKPAQTALDAEWTKLERRGCFDVSEVEPYAKVKARLGK